MCHICAYQPTWTEVSPHQRLLPPGLRNGHLLLPYLQHDQLGGRRPGPGDRGVHGGHHGDLQHSLGLPGLTGWSLALPGRGEGGGVAGRQDAGEPLPPLPQLVHMEAGDTVELQAGQAEDASTAVTFCVSLWQSEQ